MSPLNLSRAPTGNSFGTRLRRHLTEPVGPSVRCFTSYVRRGQPHNGPTARPARRYSWTAGLLSQRSWVPLIGLIIGLVISDARTSRAGKRQWWSASAFCALGTALELGIVTEGNHSRVEHDVVFAVELLLLAWCVIVTRAGRRARRRDHL